MDAGPLAFSPATNSYQPVSPSQFQPGQGYWVQFDTSTTLYLPLNGPQGASVSLPVGQWALIGNPGTTSATISGADVVYVYDPTTGAYRKTTTVGPGQGAWAFSFNGGTATIRPNS